VKYILLIIIPTGFCFYGLYFCFFKVNDTKTIILLATIIGGGLRNLIDHIFYNFSVIDFLNFGIYSLRTGILNIADLSVTFGAIFLIFHKYSQKSHSNKTEY
jgi:signal peptidase II